MSTGSTTFLYELMEVEEGAHKARATTDEMFGELLDNLVNDLMNEVGY